MDFSRLALFVCLLVLSGCPEEGSPAKQAGRIEGQVAGPGSPRGDAYVFLFAPGEGPPRGPDAPRFVTAVPELRLGAGDARFLFAEVLPGPYRLWGFLDSNGDVDLSVDVLAQPGALSSRRRRLSRTPRTGGQVFTPLEAIPVGEYQLWSLSAEGAFWYVPNALGSRDSAALHSQALRFQIVRGGSPDAGNPAR